MNLGAYSILKCGNKYSSSKIQAEAKFVIGSIKNGRLHLIHDFLKEVIEDDPRISSFFENSVLVPLPRSAPLVQGSVWPCLQICEFLRQQNLGVDIAPILSRTKKVPKAAFQTSAEDRPSVELHHETIQCDTHMSIIPGRRIILVDDLLTQGRTSMGSVKSLRNCYPDIPISLFTLVKWDSWEEIVHYDQATKSLINLYPSGKTFVEVIKEY